MCTPSSHRITVHPKAGGATVAVTGALDLVAAGEFAAAVRLAAGGPAAGNVAIDLGEVDFLDSGGLNALLAGRAEVHDLGGTFRIAVASPRARRVLELVRLVEVFAVPPAAPAAAG